MKIELNGLFTDQKGIVERGHITGHNDDGVPCRLYTWIKSEDITLVGKTFEAFDTQIKNARVKSEMDRMAIDLRIGAQFKFNGGKCVLIDVDLADPLTHQYPSRELVEGETIQYDGRLFDPIHGNMYHDNFHVVGGDGFEGQIYPHRLGVANMANFTALPWVNPGDRK